VLAYRRQVGVVLTAAFVLLSHVYCACGGAARVAATAGASEAASLPPCHRHAAATDQRGKHGPAPADRGSHSSCPHCKPLTVADGAGQKVADGLKPALWLAPFCPSSTVALTSPTAARPAFTAADLPPPSPRSTLLGLHCALNT
jgi:hypothetical protein